MVSGNFIFHILQVQFEGYVYIDTDDIIIAIDDISIEARACPAAATCNFEDGMCDWTDDPDTGITWLIQSGSHAAENSGPLSDNTLKTPYGRYYICDICTSIVKFIGYSSVE